MYIRYYIRTSSCTQINMDEDGLLRTTLRAEGLPLLGLLRQTQTKKAVYRRPLGNFWSGRRKPNRKTAERRIETSKSFRGEAPEPYSLNGQSGRSHTKTAPECRVFRYWMDKTRTKDINRRADSGRPHCSPVRSGNCPERKQKHRIPMPKTFPGKAPELLFWLSTQANLLKMAVN